MLLQLHTLQKLRAYPRIAGFVAPLSKDAVVRVSKPAPTASGGLEAVITACLETPRRYVRIGS